MPLEVMNLNLLMSLTMMITVSSVFSLLETLNKPSVSVPSCTASHVMTTSEKCPTCCQPLDAFHDRNSARRIKGMRVKCTSTGCPWINELGSLEKHLEWYVLVFCSSGCKQYIVHNKYCADRGVHFM